MKVKLLLLTLFVSVFSWGQILIPNATPVTQNFDGMAATTTLPSNWRMHASTAAPTWAGAATTVTQQASAPSPTAGGTYNFGSSASERSVGAMTSGTFASPNNLLGFFQNTNASNITALTISYDAERYRINTAAASVQFFYSLNGTTWTAVAAGDIATTAFPTGTSAYNFTTGTVVNKTGISITGLNIATNSNIYLRWNINTTGGNSQGIAIDNVSVTATFAATCAAPTMSSTVSATQNVFSDIDFTGSVTDVGGGTSITTRGFQISTSNAMTTPTDLSEVSTATGSYTLNTTLNGNTRYYYRAYAVNDCATPQTGYSSATPVTTSIVTKPFSTTANAATNISSKSFRANWTNPGVGTETFTYKLFVFVDDGTGTFIPYNTYTGISSVTPYYDLTGLTPNTAYRYYFRSNNSAGDSELPSNTIQVTTLTAATKLAYSVNPPATGSVSTNLTSFTVQAQRADNSVDTDFSGTVALTRNIITGTGNLAGTTSVALFGGSSVFNLVNINATGTYTITASLTGLTSATSGNVVISAVSSSTDYFRSRASGNWTNTTTWESSPNNATWINSTIVPTSSATQIEILNTHTVAINTSGISLTNTFVRNGGTLEVTTSTPYNLSGSAGGINIQLTVDNGGVFSIKNTGYATGNGFGLIKTGGKISADTGSDSVLFIEDYIHEDSFLYFDNASICEWNINSYPASNASTDFVDNLFFPSNVGDLPIFRISNIPAGQGYGNSNNDNIINAILELNTTTPFEINNNANQMDVYFVGGIRGNGTFIQKTAAGPGQIILGDATHVPELGGNVTIQIRTNRLKLPNGANVTSGANVIVQRNDAAAENGLIDRLGGILDVNANGILDITNMRITNNVAGSVTVNGTLRTSNTGGLYGTGSAIPSNTLIINNGSTIDYYATLDQVISSNPNYYNITFSGAGTKTPQNAISVNTNGTVRITGTPIVDFTTRNLASTAANSTAFIMDGGRLKLGTGETLPLMDGLYNLTSGVVEYVTGSAAKTIRTKSYQNIEITGNNVSNSGGNITLNDNGTFTIKTGGVFTINDDAIVGPIGIQTVTVESGAIFKTGDIHGFNGGTATTATSIRSDIENIVLSNGSTVEYSRGNPFASGDQTITLFSPSYRNLTVSGTGVKTLQNDSATRVEENLNVAASKLLLNINQILTVKQGIFIATTDAELELENNAQLIQIDESDTNSGTNFKLKRLAFVHAQDYVYWSSPVLDFNVGLIPTQQRYFWNPLFVNTNGTVGNWNSATGADATMIKGKGYIVNSGSGFPIRPLPATSLETNFVGRPNNGTLTSTIQRGSNALSIDDNWNLIGNPYPSAIFAEEFLDANVTKINGSVWVWTHGQAPDNAIDPYYDNFGANYYATDYLKYNKLGATDTTFNGIIASGQGFMVNMLHTTPSTSETVTFTNAMRTDGTATPYNNSGFYKTANTNFTVVNPEEKHRIWLTIINTAVGQKESALLGYSANSTLAVDHFYDCIYVPRTEVGIYTLVNTGEYVIQGRPLPFVDSDLVPFGVKIVNAGSHKIALKKVDGLFEGNQEIYLEDTLLSIVHDLKAAPYTFTSEVGVFNSRFIIRYTTSALANEDFDSVNNSVTVSSQNDAIAIKSESELMSSAIVYDILGRELARKNNINANDITFLNLSALNQALIVKITLENGQVVTRKIIL